MGWQKPLEETSRESETARGDNEDDLGGRDGEGIRPGETMEEEGVLRSE